jgi:putative transcriptional regulator
MFLYIGIKGNKTFPTKVVITKMERTKMVQFRGERSRPKVAEQIGITPQMLGAIERGERTPSLNLAKKIADFYSTTIDEIFFGDSGHETGLK